jgi:hypothetical protein
MQHFIGYRILAAIDTRWTDEQERRRESSLRQEFFKLVPVADRLIACELLLQRHHSENGCRLEYYIALPPQHSLDFNGAGEIPPADANDIAAFHTDVANVTAQCKDVKTRLVLAQSPGLGRQELAGDSQAVLDKRALRSLFRRRERKVVLPTPNGDLSLDLPAVPAHLATGMRCEIAALVTKLTPNHRVNLRNLQWKAAEDGPMESPISLPDSVLAMRADLQPDRVMRLVEGMDAARELTLGVQIDFDWTTGEASTVMIHSVGAL